MKPDLAQFMPPFHADKYGCFIRDACGSMAADFHEEKPRARGWGRIGYLKNADARFEAWRAFFYEHAGDAADLSEAADRLNAALKAMEGEG